MAAALKLPTLVASLGHAHNCGRNPFQHILLRLTPDISYKEGRGPVQTSGLPVPSHQCIGHPAEWLHQGSQQPKVYSSTRACSCLTTCLTSSPASQKDVFCMLPHKPGHSGAHNHPARPGQRRQQPRRLSSRHQRRLHNPAFPPQNNSPCEPNPAARHVGTATPTPTVPHHPTP